MINNIITELQERNKQLLNEIESLKKQLTDKEKVSEQISKEEFDGLLIS